MGRSRLKSVAVTVSLPESNISASGVHCGSAVRAVNATIYYLLESKGLRREKRRKHG